MGCQAKRHDPFALRDIILAIWRGLKVPRFRRCSSQSGRDAAVAVCTNLAADAPPWVREKHDLVQVNRH